MPRTKSQAQQNTPAPAPTPAKAKPPSATTRRQAPRARAASGQDVHPRPPTILPAANSQEASQAISTTPASSSTRDHPQDHPGPQQVSVSPQVPKDLTALWPDLQALAHWWQERQRLAQQDETPDRQLVRQTYHIEQRYIDAVRREADRTGESYAAVVNRAFARYFAGR
jgi:hypothetical protein